MAELDSTSVVRHAAGLTQMNPSLEKLHESLCSSVRGAEKAAAELIAAILAGGHVLIEGAPGVGKTTLVKTLAAAMASQFRRVQFTPDLLPADLLGYSMYRQNSGEFEFIEGPVFSDLLLADEINRTSPRIQSALLECMNERQVSIDGATYPLGEHFHVIATQNNRFATGTFPLPEPQLDRFLISIEMALPQAGVQVDMLQAHLDAQQASGEGAHGSVASLDDLARWKQETQSLPIARPVCDYIVRLCEALRHHKELDVGISNRASIALGRFAQALAYLEESPAVYPDHVKSAFIPVMAHRCVGEGTVGNRNPAAKRGQAIVRLREVLGAVEVD